MSTEGIFQWITGCCAPSVGANEYSILSRNPERPVCQWQEKEALIPRNYEEIKQDQVQYFANSEASAGVGIIFQSTKPGYRHFNTSRLLYSDILFCSAIWDWRCVLWRLTDPLHFLETSSLATNSSQSMVRKLATKTARYTAASNSNTARDNSSTS